MDKVSVFLDTDIGDDIDDTWALAFLLNCPEIKLEYALTCNSPAPYRAKLIAKILQWAGDTTTPIGFGIPTAPKNIPMGFRKSQAAWIEDFELKKVPNPIFENGVEEFVKKIMDCPGTPVIVAIGPLVNIARAIEIEPAIVQKSRIVIMGGSIRIGYSGKSTPSLEYNIAQYPQAAQKVFSAPWKDTLIVPLDTCGYIYLNGPDYQKICESDTPMAKAVTENYFHWNHDAARHFGQYSSLLCDTVAVYFAFEENNCVIENLPIRVTENGYTVIDEINGRMCRAATGWKDFQKFKEFLTQRLLQQ